MHYLRSYLKACHICQLARNDKPPSRQLQTRMNLNYRPTSRLSMDLKVIPRSQKGNHYILCVIDEVTNYLITAPIYQAKSEEIGDTLIENVISKFGTPEYIIMDRDSAFMSTLMNYLFKRLGIKIKTVGSIQSSIPTGRTWNQVSVHYFDKTPHGSRTKLEQTPVFSYISVQHI